MKNVNIQARKNQVLILVMAFLFALSVVGIMWYFTSAKGSIASPLPKEPVPDLTGVVNATFDNKVQQNVITEAQRVGKEMSHKFQSMEREIRALSDNNISLQKQVTDLQYTRIDLLEKTANTNNLANNEKENRAQNSTALPLGDQKDYRYGGVGTAAQGQLRILPFAEGRMHRQVFSDDVKDIPVFVFPYIPSGSYVESVVIEGADTNAAVTGSQNTSPMQLRLTGKVQMPNDKTFDLAGCFVTLEAYGDVSSERAEVRTRKLSCNIHDEVIDQKIEGHVSFMGKNGIKGDVVMRNGQMLGWAWGAGFINGIGEGVKSAGSTAVGMGATASPSAGNILKSGIGGGTSEAAKTLSDYYIKRAEQYHPVIPIGAGNEVTLVFHDGFQIQTVAETLRKKQQENPASRDKTANTGTFNDIKKFNHDIKQFELGDVVSVDALKGSLPLPEK